MLEIFRRKIHGIITIGIISVIALAFALWGLGDYFTAGSGQGVAAIVDGKKISWQMVDAVYHRLHKHFGADANERALKEQLRMALVQRAALLSHAKSLGFQIGDIQLAEALIQMPAFQTEGKFSKERYLEVLRQVGYKDAEFRQELAQDLLIAQLEQGITQSNFSLQPELSRLVSLLDQKRDFGYFILSAKDYRKDIKISPEDIQTYYENHKTHFILPEKVSIEYVALSVDDLARPIEVSEEALKSYYDQHASFYTAPESLHARHILITVPQTANMKEEDAKAKEKITKILAELKEGADFVTLAKQYSQDEGSATSGGDLGWFTHGQMVPEFEQAAFNMKEANEIAGPVRSQFGYHIIQLIEKKAKDQRPFDEIKTLVKEQYQREKALAIFSDKTEEMAKLAYDSSDTLAPLAKALNLNIETTELFARQGGQEDFTKHPALVKAAFSEEVLNNKHNSEPFKLNESTMVVIRVKEHKPAEQQTLEQVENRIVDNLTAQRAIAKVKELGENFAKELKDKPEQREALVKQHNLNWIEKTDVARNGDADASILPTVFQAKHPMEGKPSIESIALPTGDYAVVIVSKVQPGDLEKVDGETQIGYKKGLSEIFSQIEFNLYANQVYKGVKAEFPEAPKNQ